MKTIWKYPIDIVSEQTIQMPDLTFLHVGLDPGGALCLWALVDPDAPLKPVRINIFGTGHIVPENITQHIGSVVQDEFVWHVFREIP